jgi:2',3'-cyclic-nucleotide 2'-phosphodiesterase (5'-nucleotidase family)
MPTGTLRFIKAQANPHGAADSDLFLFVGNPTVGPIREIVPDAGVVLPQMCSKLSSRTCRLKILHINDLHGHIARILPHGNQPILSRIVSRLREVRQKHEDDPDTAVLTMSAGDDLVGAIFDELMGDDPDSFALHAGYRLYSAAGMDVSVLGNHDLDLGTDVLAEAIRKDARFPVLSANLVNCRWLEGLVYPAALWVTKGMRVGIIGLTPPAQVRQLNQSNLQIVNPIQVIHNLLPAIRPYCDVLIILSHLGYSLTSSSAATVGDAGDVELARSLPSGDVHLIVGGHTHHVLNEQGLSVNNIVNGIPIVQAGTLGRFLGEVTITVQEGETAVTNVRLTRAAYQPVDQQFETESVQPLLEIARPLFSRTLGKVVNHPDLSTDAIRNNFAAEESALANFIADALVTRCRANGYDTDLAFIDASIIRRGLPAGDLSFGDWFNLMPFADILRITWVSGEQLHRFVQDNAYRIDLPSEPHTERGFLHFSQQLRYIVQLAPHRANIQATNITVNGIPLEHQLDRSFAIVCTSFVRGLSAGWEKYGRRMLNLPLIDMSQIPHLDTSLFLRDELVAYITEHGGVTEAGGLRRNGRLQIIKSKTGKIKEKRVK